MAPLKYWLDIRSERLGRFSPTSTAVSSATTVLSSDIPSAVRFAPRSFSALRLTNLTRLTSFALAALTTFGPLTAGLSLMKNLHLNRLLYMTCFHASIYLDRSMCGAYFYYLTSSVDLQQLNFEDES